MDAATPTDPTPADTAEPTPEPLGLGLRWSDPDSPLARLYLRFAHLVAAVLITAAFVLYSWTPLWHTDLWGHLAFGRWIVEHQALPSSEPFTPHGERTPAIGHFNWLSQVAGYVLFRSGAWLAGDVQPLRFQGGAEAVRVAFALATGLLLLLLFRAYSHRAGSPWLAVAGLAMVLLLSFSVFSVQRPQVIGLVLFAALLGILTPPLLSWRTMLAVPVLFVLWANAHGSYVMGLVLVGVCLAGRVIEGFTTPGKRWRDVLRDAQVLRLAVGLALSLLGVLLLNPHGPSLVGLTLALSRHPNIRQLEEWSPLVFAWGPGGHWGYVATLVIVLGSQLLSRRALSPTSLLLIATFGVWPCVQQRMMLWWILLWPWIVLPLWAETTSRLFGQAETRPRGNLLYTLVVCLVAGIGIVLSPAAQWVLGGKPRTPLEQMLSAGTPLRLGPKGEVQGRVFCSEMQGDFLIWQAFPGRQVLVYTHAHLFPPGHWDRCMATKFGEPGWRDNLDRWQANLVVIEPRLHPRLAEQLRKDVDWEVTLDEADDNRIPDPRGALFVARRKQPW